MSATGKTVNYNLPIFNTGDSTAWADFNKAMTLLDDALKNIEVFSNNTDIKTNNNTNAISDIETSVESLQNETDVNSVDISNLKTKTNILEKHENEQDLKIVNLESISGENGRDLELLSNRVEAFENMNLQARPITITTDDGSVRHSANNCVEVYTNGSNFKLSIINASFTYIPPEHNNGIARFTLDNFNALGVSILDCLITPSGIYPHKPAFCIISNKKVEIYENDAFTPGKEYTIDLNGVVVTLE